MRPISWRQLRAWPAAEEPVDAHIPSQALIWGGALGETTDARTRVTLASYSACDVEAVIARDRDASPLAPALLDEEMVPLDRPILLAAHAPTGATTSSSSCCQTWTKPPPSPFTHMLRCDTSFPYSAQTNMFSRSLRPSR